MKTEHWIIAAGLSFLCCTTACDDGKSDTSSEEGEDSSGEDSSGEDGSSTEEGSGEESPEEGSGSEGTEESGSAISYEDDIQPIWDDHCTGASCHSLFPPVLDPGASYDAIVDTESPVVSDMVFVSPGSVDDSYLYIKITDGEGIVGAVMPSGEDPLPQETIDLIEEWINAGAPE